MARTEGEGFALSASRFETADPDVLMRNVGEVARVLQRAVNRGEHARVRGELLQLGTLAWPVLLELYGLLKPAGRIALKENLIGAATTTGPPSRRSMTNFNTLLSLFQGMRERKEL